MNGRARFVFGETHWVSCLRENLTSSSDGEGLETGRFHSGTAPVPYRTAGSKKASRR